MQRTNQQQPKQFQPKVFDSQVYCALCTHTVSAKLITTARGAKVIAGQKCSRCQANLDAAFVLSSVQAA